MLSQNQIKILIIDDDEDDFFIISDYLNEIDKNKFIIEWCNTYSSAIEHFKANNHDIYFVDYRLGNETGLELLKEAIALHCDDPIILLTGKGNKAIDIEAMKAGATDYLIKSDLNSEKLERCIRYSLDRAASLKTIRQSEKRLKTFFQSGPDAVVVLNENQEILEWNPKAETIFGYRANEVIGKNLLDVISPDQYSLNGMADFFKAGEGAALNKTIEITALHKNGNKFYVNVSISNVKLGDQWIFIAFLSDITERKKTEEALIHKEAELLQAKLLEEKKDEFISIASHELKTPLTTIKAYAQMALNVYGDKQDEPVYKFISKVDQYTHKLTSLINELLDVSRIHAGKLSLMQTEVEMDSFLPDVINSMQHITQQHEIIVQKNEAAKVKIDAIRLEQVITNIISNATKYSPGKKMVIVNSVKDNSDIIISFTDFGIGIPQEKINKIFDRFYRVDEVSKDFSGLGIGLFISSEIIKQHGGKIWAESKEGEGSTFYFSLPAIEN